MANTKQVGDETEAKVIAALIEAGHSVSVPFGDNDRYDLIVEIDHELRRVQCKTGWLEQEGAVIRFKTASKTTSDGTPVARGYDGEVDAFAVRCRETDTLYWVPVEDAGSKSSYLRRTDPEIDHPGINRASEYRFDATIP